MAQRYVITAVIYLKGHAQSARQLKNFLATLFSIVYKMNHDSE